MMSCAQIALMTEKITRFLSTLNNFFTPPPNLVGTIAILIIYSPISLFYYFYAFQLLVNLKNLLSVSKKKHVKQ
jgi:hypothetical protein